jgi:hypothetical protein
MRWSGQAHMWSPRGFASHIHVLNREVPFILNITLGSVRKLQGNGFEKNEHAHGGSWGASRGPFKEIRLNVICCNIYINNHSCKPIFPAKK